MNPVPMAAFLAHALPAHFGELLAAVVAAQPPPPSPALAREVNP